MRAAVTIDTGGSLPVSCLDRLGVIAAIVGRLLVRVTLGTRYFCGRGFVRRAFNVGVAIDASEHAAVNRVLECVGIDEQTHLLAVGVLGHGGIAVAYQAVFVAGLRGWLLGSESRQDREN